MLVMTKSPAVRPRLFVERRKTLDIKAQERPRSLLQGRFHLGEKSEKIRQLSHVVHGEMRTSLHSHNLAAGPFDDVPTLW